MVWGGGVSAESAFELSVVFLITTPAGESTREAVGREGEDNVEGFDEGGVSVLLTAWRRDWTVRGFCAVLPVLGPILTVLPLC